MTIRQTSLLIALALAVLFLGVTVLKISQLFGERSALQQVAFTADAASTLNEAIIELSLERSVMQVTLNLPDPIAPQFRALIDAQRGLFAERFGPIRDAVAGNDNVRRGETFLAEMQRLGGRIQDIRREADRLLAMPGADRDPLRVQALPDQMKAVIEEFARLPSLIRAEGVRVPSVVQTLENIQRRAWEVREFGGQERTFFAIATATGQPIPAPVVAEMAALHKRAFFALETLGIYRDYQGLPADIAAQIDDARAFYLGQYGDVREAVLRASAAGDDYPIAFAAFFELSSGALGRAVNLSGDAGSAIRAELERITTAASYELAAYWGLLALAMALCGVQILYTRNGVAKRIDGIIGLMDRLTDGDTTIDPSPFRSRDEVGRMARAVEVFRDRGIEAEELRAEQKRLGEESVANRVKALRAMAESVETETRAAVDMVEKETNRLAQVADRLAEDARQVSQASGAASDASNQALRNQRTVAGATEQLSVSIGEIRRQFDTLAEITKQAVTAGTETQAQIAALEEEIGKIGSVVGVIGDIAEQTNLLALNATIEAARAGDAGKGFAVVAGEVKTLSAQTTNATGEIRALIEGIGAATRSSVASVRVMIEGVQRIDDMGKTVAKGAIAQETATKDIAGNILQSTQASEEVTNQIGSVARDAENTGTNAAQVAEISGNLALAVDDLRERLVRNVRTASPEVDRRTEERHQLVRAITVTVGGEEWRGCTVDVSQGGAKIALEQRLEPGSTGTVTIEGVPRPIKMLVEASSKGFANINFNPEPDREALVDAVLKSCRGAPQPGSLAA